MNNELKKAVKDHWEAETCGVRYGEGDEIEKARYTLEPYICDFAQFNKAKDKKVLEIGVGAGVDFVNWLRNGAHAVGVDLTEAAINITRKRVQENRIHANMYSLRTADAENLPFADNEFDIVYSWGVLHHTPDTVHAFHEAYRVLSPGGELKAMIYHVRSFTGILLWIQHCLLKGKPYKGLKYAIYHHLESPGTKAYTLDETWEFLHEIGFKNINLKTILCAGDLLNIKPSRKYQSPIYKLIWKLYPRWFVKLVGNGFGLNLLIEAEKPTNI